MHVYKLADATLDRPSIVTIGVFDGVHRGHQDLIRRLVDAARERDYAAVVLTFFPHPDLVLREQTGPYYLMHPEERAAMLVSMGIDLVVTQTFDDELRAVRAQNFVATLSHQLQMKSLWVGRNFVMGYEREGNVAYLAELGQEHGFEVVTVELVGHQDNGSTITSTGIRTALQAGEVEMVRKWLGRAYTVTGEIVHGHRRGHQIGFPTANIDVWLEQMVPANGVYAGWATLGAERFMAVTNIGVRPTFNGSGMTVEAHLLDFDRDIYGEQMTLSFDHYLRAEQKFAGIGALKDQLMRDVEAGRACLMAQEPGS